MTDAAAPPPDTPDPLHGHVPIPPMPMGSSANDSVTPASSFDATPLGAPRQYHRAPSLPNFENQKSVTGATKEDPAGVLVREAVISDPEWASPLLTVWVVLMRGYATSFLIYWFGYGFCLMASLGMAEALFGHVNYLTPEVMSATLLIGPLMGPMMDFSILVSSTAAALLGGLFLVLEPMLAFLILITHESRPRLKYCGLMFGLVLAKAVVYVLANSAS